MSHFVCRKCALYKKSAEDKAVTGEGPKPSNLMIIGQCPGSVERDSGQMFTGKVGIKLDTALQLANISKPQVYMTYIVKHFSPPGKALNKTFVKMCCREYLQKEIEEVQPKVIVCLGAKAASFFGSKFIANSHFYNKEFNTWVIVTHHPVRLLYTTDQKMKTEFNDAFKQATILLTQQPAQSDPPVEYLEKPTLADLEKLGPIIALDIETTNVHFLTDKVLSLGFSDGVHNIAIPFCTNDLVDIVDKELLNEFLSTRKIIGHNVKFDYKFLKKNGVDFNIYFDTMQAHAIIDRLAMSHGLAEIALKYLHTKLTKGTIDFDNDAIDTKERSIYAANDAYMTYKVYKMFDEKIEQEGYHDLFYNIVMPTNQWLADAEYRGVEVDREYIKSYIVTAEYKLKSIMSDVKNDSIVTAFCTANNIEDFNIKSPKQLGELLYTHLKLSVGTGQKKDTTELTLNILAKKYKQFNFLQGIVHYRHLYKSYRTYLKNLLDFSEVDNRIHCQYNQTRVITGRLSSTKPNLQNLPKPSEEDSVKNDQAKIIRKAFVATKGFTLIEADFKQAEFRALASYSKDPQMIEWITEGKDIHTIIASLAYLKKEEDITDFERTLAKTVTFGVMYGRGANSIAEQFNISVEEAQGIKNTFFNTFKGAARWMEHAKKFAQANGYVKNLAGRRIPLPQIYSQEKEIAAHAIRCSVNYPIQGAAADLTNLAGALVYNEFKKQKLEAYIIMNIHDAIVVECKNDIVDLVTNIMKECMEREVRKLLNFRVPLIIDIKMGNNLSFKE